MAAPTEGHDFDNFKAEFKYYKRREPPPDLSNVIDFDEAGKITLAKFSKVKVKLML